MISIQHLTHELRMTAPEASSTRTNRTQAFGRSGSPNRSDYDIGV